MNELLIVDHEDHIIGYDEKLHAHREGRLHRAFSLFVYDPEKHQVLIQKRAEGKYHSGGLWTNTCCSHQYKDESWDTALSRCLMDELRLRVNVQAEAFDHQPEDGLKDEGICIQAGVFQYFSDYGEMKEHEIDHVFVGCLSRENLDQIDPEPEEISRVKWIGRSELDEWLDKEPEAFTSWFAKAYAFARLWME